MKRNLILIALILLTTVSCSHKVHKEEEKTQPTPLTEAEKKEMEIQDSLKQVTTDSLALIAWGDAKFGMSMKQVYATEAFKKGIKHSDQITMDFERVQIFAIATGLEELYSIRSFFKEDKLTRLEIESSDLQSNKINKLLKDCNVFVENFKEKYGNPLFFKDKVNISDFDDASKLEYAKFQIGKKTITISLIYDSLNYIYRYIIYINNSEFPKKPIPTEQEKREKEKYRKELKAIKENSF